MSFLQDHTTSELVTDGVIAGYVFAGATSDLVQRLEWVLFDDGHDDGRRDGRDDDGRRDGRDNDGRGDGGAITLRAVTDPAWEHHTLAAFARHIAGCARPRWRYCHAHATTRHHARPQEYTMRPEAAGERSIAAPLWVVQTGRSGHGEGGRDGASDGGAAGITGLYYARRRAGERHPGIGYWSFAPAHRLAPGQPFRVCPLVRPVVLTIDRTIKIITAHDHMPPTP